MSAPNAVAEWGTLLVETDVDRLVLTQLALWLPQYLRQAEIERGLPVGLLARPGAESFQNVLESDDFPDVRLPAVICTTARADAAPDKGRDDGGWDRWQATWRVQVSVVVRGRTAPETREIAAVFGGCVRRILTQRQIDLEGEVWWTGSAVAPLTDQSDKGRWLASGVNQFNIFSDDALSGGGPVLPGDQNPYPDADPTDPTQPYDPLAIVQTVDETITPRS